MHTVCIGGHNPPGHYPQWFRLVQIIRCESLRGVCPLRAAAIRIQSVTHRL